MQFRRLQLFEPPVSLSDYSGLPHNGGSSQDTRWIFRGGILTQ